MERPKVRMILKTMMNSREGEKPEGEVGSGHLIGFWASAVGTG